MQPPSKPYKFKPIEVFILSGATRGGELRAKRKLCKSWSEAEQYLDSLPCETQFLVRDAGQDRFEFFEPGFAEQAEPEVKLTKAPSRKRRTLKTA